MYLATKHHRLVHGEFVHGGCLHSFIMDFVGEGVRDKLICGRVSGHCIHKQQMLGIMQSGLQMPTPGAMTPQNI